jgi:predicted  nucleic acid-binding Zn-ribbon protein
MNNNIKDSIIDWIISNEATIKDLTFDLVNQLNETTFIDPEFEEQIEERLLAAYKRIRSSVRNGLAVVSIERGASAGSFFTIPPQIQVEIAARKKIITDEHSGRILVDASLAEEEKEKMEKIFAKM